MMSRSVIRIACRTFLVVIPLLAVATIAAIILYWGLGIHRLGDNVLILHSFAPVPERRMYGLLAALVPTIFSLIAMRHLFRVFKHYDAAGIIVIEIVRHLRGFSLFSVLTALSAFLLSGAMRWAMGVFDDAPLYTHLGFSLASVILVFFSLVIYVASWLIEEGLGYSKEINEYV